MKGILATMAVAAVLGGCATGAPAPSTSWTNWVCDSKAQVHWRYADAAHKAVNVKLNQSDQEFRLEVQPGSSNELYSNGVLSFLNKGSEGLVYWDANNDLIGRGCKAPNT